MNCSEKNYPPDQTDYWPNIKIQFVGEMAAILNLAAILDFLIWVIWLKFDQ